ncbi:hypothetical protein [Xenorhabdus bovienii]|uniref:hypothetical protein n=1 Tax=Xenorhabdus bovienii TaxID=40576 RepID=UPI0023B288F6|nr:hypothetical protein [Xenorhabdus bovienii]MDE9536593.1 hypothetical protein [Xenorhabdus bovienii]MDE9589124.1 hypothetical protein [Xenorhabdus bovienii]
MTVMTIYFCGTGSTKYDNTHHNYWSGELISSLAEHQDGKEFAEWNIVDGPGSGNLMIDQLWVESTIHPDFMGKAFGKGWKENVDHVLHILKGTFEKNQKLLTPKQCNILADAGVPVDSKNNSFLCWRYSCGKSPVTSWELQQQIIEIHRKTYGPVTQVNLVGWSRGGISCHMLANAMLHDQVLKNIPVNIFAVDPVPGPLQFPNVITTLGNNVKEYVAFYALNERSKNFTCEIPKTEKSTRVHIFPMPGRHATLAGNGFEDGEGKTPNANRLKEPGCLVRHFAEVCLTRWGVKFKAGKTLALSNEEIRAYHQTMEKDRQIYQKMQSKYYVSKWLVGFGGLEDIKGERIVSNYDKSVAFSSTRGDQFSPKEGLAARGYA